MKSLLTITLFIAALAVTAEAGPKRVDVSPAILYNLGSGHSGELMGGAVTGDFFLNRWFAVRTTLGYTKDRYFPPDENYDDADHGLWFSVAPYAEISALGTVRPYLAVLGTFAASGAGGAPARPIVQNELAPVNRLQTANGTNNAWSLGGTVGAKLAVAGPLAIYGEVTHFFYSSISRSTDTFNTGLPDVTFNYDWDRSPTYLSLGMSYSFSLGNKSEERE